MAVKNKPVAEQEPVEDTGGHQIPLTTEEEWDSAQGQEYGGASEIFKLEPGQIGGPVMYQGHQQIETDLGETTVHLAADEEGEQWRLPIQATFLRAMNQANIKVGDKFLIRRLPDQTKKRGKGKGNPMAMYAIKVIERNVNGQAVPPF